MRSVKVDWIQDLYYREFQKPKLKADEFYCELACAGGSCEIN